MKIFIVLFVFAIKCEEQNLKNPFDDNQLKDIELFQDEVDLIEEMKDDIKNDQKNSNSDV